MTLSPTSTGVVVIGRNEGDRLSLCLASVLDRGRPVVYADSGSTDGSPDRARALGAQVVLLDDSAPHTAARGRNAGVDRLEAEPAARPVFVQFVDGDCELHPDWIDAAARQLESQPRTAIVTGHLVERHRDSSIYARLLNMEWQGPVGRIDACGGIFMIRVSAFREVGGFVAGQAVGEEPDLCARLRAKGWEVVRLDLPMGTHDAGMTRLVQWWKRTVRAGYFLAQRASAASAERSLRNMKRALATAVWAVGIPAVVVVLAAVAPLRWFGVAAGLGAAAYLLLAFKIYRHRRRQGNTPADARLYAVFCVLAKWPEFLGQLRFWFSRPRQGPRPDSSVAAG